MTQAELHLEAHDAAAALDTIRELHSSGARHVQAIRLEFLACQQAELWDEVIRLSRLLDKRKAMHPAVLSQARARAYIELIQRRGGDASSLRQLWGDMTTADRATSAVVHAAARAFADLGEHAHAVQILQHALNHDWQPGLVLLYGQMGGDETISAQIHTAEIWLHHHAQDVALLSTLGKLCMRAQLWGKAADYLQRSLRVETTRYALLTLAQLMEHNGDEEQANHYYRECALFNQVVSQ
jgi:HemY protein